MGRPAIDLVGQRFHRLVVLRRDDNAVSGAGKHARWMCHCDCGNETSVLSHVLKNGDQKSCGCYSVERAHYRNRTHGLYGTLMYNRWNGMMDRCYCPTNPGFKYYGGRGIKVCERWHNPANFYADMGDPPFEGATLDRINNDGDYEPGNVRWATLSQQNQNRRKPKRTARGQIAPAEARA